jgi:hypothetical protein
MNEVHIELPQRGRESIRVTQPEAPCRIMDIDAIANGKAGPRKERLEDPRRVHLPHRQRRSALGIQDDLDRLCIGSKRADGDPSVDRVGT